MNGFGLLQRCKGCKFTTEPKCHNISRFTGAGSLQYLKNRIAKHRGGILAVTAFAKAKARQLDGDHPA